MKKYLAFLFLSFFLFGSVGFCQRPYYGALEYSLPHLASVPPHYSGQPSDVSEAYTLLDLAMRYANWDQTDKFIARMGYGDTAKYVIDMIYRVTDDNPLLFAQWTAVHTWSGFHYTNEPGHAWTSFRNRIGAICPDTGRTAMLTVPDIIADIKTTDTSSVFDPTAAIAKHMVGVNCQILDEIKGKHIVGCPDIYKTHKGGISPQSAASPMPATSVSADSGTCLQFEYSLEWRRTASKHSDWGLGSNPLFDSVNGTWIKPDSEYIVFLHFVGVGGDSNHFYFTVEPLIQGSCAGMYPVRAGKVFDPNDDFGIGASTGLTVSDWKYRLRARIYSLMNP